MSLHRGAALLAELGYQHSVGGLWYDRSAPKVFTDEWVWQRDEVSLRADLAADTRRQLKIYASWPLAPEQRLAAGRLVAVPGTPESAGPRATNHAPGNWQAHARAFSPQVVDAN